MLATSAPAGASSPVLHEPILADPRDDLALAVSLDGDLPAVMDTPSGAVAAPDPSKAPGPNDPSSVPSDIQGRRFDGGPSPTFTPDNDTSRPDTLPYEDPFTPSTAPFKRLIAFDAVDAAYNLIVRDARLAPLGLHEVPRADGGDEQFYGDIVVDLSPGRRVRVPTVGPDARVVHAHLGVGASDVPFRLWHDSADNWFIDSEHPAVRARFVVELTIQRATFGGDFGDPRARDLSDAPRLPPKVLADANKVISTIGVPRTSPREMISGLVEYFRGFVDSSDHPTGHGNVYLDLALSRKGVCRHRAYAFMVTALALGIPTRMVLNEAHAWVEVYTGSLWKRIDLGGAGRTLRDTLASDVPYAPPPDPFEWPAGATRGEDLAQRARAAGRQSTGGGTGAAGAAAAGVGSSRSAGTAPASSAPGSQSQNDTTAGDTAVGASDDDRPAAHLDLRVLDSDSRRGSPLRVGGSVRGGSDACEHVTVQVSLRDAHTRRERFLGTLATDETGTFAGGLIVPATTPVGDYDVVARTPGDTRCAAGSSP
jgi:transglutaminase-like putative cysteine protease